MIAVLEPYSSVLTNTKQELPDILKNIFRKREELILSIIKNDQLRKGIYPDGDVVGKYKAVTEFFYAKTPPYPIKPKKTGQPYNFEWTGRWMKGLQVEMMNEDNYDIFSIDGKHKLLMNKYGEDLLKMSPKANEFINESILKIDLFQEIVDRLKNAA